VDVSNTWTTSATLLGRLRREDGDPEAWSEFVRRYGPLLYHWCRRWKLQEADAHDVAQDVFARLIVRLRTFRYDPKQSFRSYVRSVAHYALCDFHDSRRRLPGGSSGDSGVFDLLGNVAARDDLQQCLAAAFDHEHLDTAMARVQLRVELRTWEAFRLTTFDNLSGAEAAARTGMEVATVFKAKSKVQKMLREEVRRLEEDW
jgi:RNA polymerase sigma factor (sigma-70 family)